MDMIGPGLRRLESGVSVGPIATAMISIHGQRPIQIHISGTPHLSTTLSTYLFLKFSHHFPFKASKSQTDSLCLAVDVGINNRKLIFIFRWFLNSEHKIIKFYRKQAKCNEKIPAR